MVENKKTLESLWNFEDFPESLGIFELNVRGIYGSCEAQTVSIIEPSRMSCKVQFRTGAWILWYTVQYRLVASSSHLGGFISLWPYLSRNYQFPFASFKQRIGAQLMAGFLKHPSTRCYLLHLPQAANEPWEDEEVAECFSWLKIADPNCQSIQLNSGLSLDY